MRTIFSFAAAVVVLTLGLSAQEPAVPGQLLPGTPSNVLSSIVGNALTSVDSALPGTPIRLRDARTGRIVVTVTSDQAGVFTFKSLDPGSYIVEVLDADQKVLAASDLINVNGGETAMAVVKLPFQPPALAGLFGHSGGQAATILAAAATSGVLSTIVSGDPVSP